MSLAKRVRVRVRLKVRVRVGLGLDLRLGKPGQHGCPSTSQDQAVELGQGLGLAAEIGRHPPVHVQRLGVGEARKSERKDWEE